MKALVTFLSILLISFSAMGNDNITIRSVLIPPYINSPNDGIFINKMNKVLKCADIHYEVIITPWKRALRSAIQKDGAVIPSMKTKEREKKLWYPDKPILNSNYRFFKKSFSVIDWDGDYLNLGNLSIGKLRGGAVGKDFDAYNSRLNIHEASSFEILLRLLDAGRIDLVAVDEENAKNIIEKHNYKIEPVGPVLDTRPLYIAFNNHELTAEQQNKINYCLKTQ